MPSNWTIPPFAHPLPERKLGIVVTDEGLYILPRTTHADKHHAHHHGHSHSQSHSQGQSQQPQPLPNHRQSSSTPSSPPPAGGAKFSPFSAAKRLTNGHLGLRLAGSPSPPTATAQLPHASAPILPDAVRIGWGKDGNLDRIPHATWTSAFPHHHSADAEDREEELTVHGVVGLERLFNRAYLFVVTGRKEAGELGHPSRKVYCCSGVLAIPLDADKAREVVKAQIAKDKAAKKNETNASSSESDGGTSGDETEDEEEDEDDVMDNVETPAAIPKEPFFSDVELGSGSATVRAPKSKPWSQRASVRTFSQSRLGKPDQEEHALESNETKDVDLPAADPTITTRDEGDANAEQGIAEEVVAATPDEQWRQATRIELEEKVVKETSKHFARGEFWFAYDFDLTTSMQKKHDVLVSSTATGGSGTKGAGTKQNDAAAPTPMFEEPLANLPLWRRADRRFFHNEHLSRELIAAGLDAFILPVMQGYLQIVPLPITETAEASDGAPAATPSATLVIISRRSKERAGLRYQRRGINETGQVANFVETEQLLLLRLPCTASSASSASSSEATGWETHLFSFVQIRGSIPLFWSQSPFSLKPPPILERGEKENNEACRKHFDVQTRRYGKLVCINLAEQGGKEGVISKKYKETVEKLALFEEGKVRYRDFDFHKECAGMKFENVQNLIEDMAATLAEFSYFHLRSDPSTSGVVEVASRQTGSARVSCLDCLDRTNVVQSAFGRVVLQGWLDGLGIAGNDAVSAA